MEKCFVIQPFDGDKFDKRYKDTFKPAILEANLEPYRTDEDNSVSIPIEEIEKGIQESKLCFAEITTDNPNVWYELGFAFASGKEVVMVCSDERKNGKYPFDIQHRSIIKYKTGSSTDYVDLKAKITSKIRAFQKKAKTLQSLANIPIITNEGLKNHEIAVLVIILANQISPEDSVSVYGIKSEMEKAGYTDVAASMGIRMLVRNEMIEIFKAMADDFGTQPYTACRLTQKGETWLLENQHQLKFTKDKKDIDDELPF